MYITREGRPTHSVCLLRMFHTCYVKAFCLLLVAQNKFGFARDEEGLPGAVTAHNTNPDQSEVLDKPKSGIVDCTRSSNGRRSENHSTILNHLSESSLKDVASRVIEILDGVSGNLTLEGAKTIQNGGIRLSELNKNLNDKISELVTNGSKYGKHVSTCMNRTVFEIGLDKILEETMECYSKSLLSVEQQLKRVEEEEGAMLERMGNYSMTLFDMLSSCFLKESVPDVIECLQRVDGTDIGSHIRDGEVADQIAVIAGFVNDIPRGFSWCSSKGLVETEAHVRNGYAQSLSCLKEHIT